MSRVIAERRRLKYGGLVALVVLSALWSLSECGPTPITLPFGALMGPNVFLRATRFPMYAHWQFFVWYGAGLMVWAPIAFLAARDEQPSNQIGLGLAAVAIWAFYGLFAVSAMST
jgi:hypothetical protein